MPALLPVLLLPTLLTQELFHHNHMIFDFLQTPPAPSSAAQTAQTKADAPDPPSQFHLVLFP